MKFVFMGPPGAGKGTQAKNLSQKYNIPAISTGAMIRNAINNATELGIKAKEYIDLGQLVPDELIIEIVKQRIGEKDCENGFILDGFPRTVNQAENLDAMGVDLKAVIYIYVPDSEIVERILGRFECEYCQSIYHVKYGPPKKTGVCDVCGKELSHRNDDTEETIKKRLEVYHSLTEPLKNYYNEKNLLITVRGREKIEDTTRDLLKLLEDRI